MKRNTFPVLLLCLLLLSACSGESPLSEATQSPEASRTPAQTESPPSSGNPATEESPAGAESPVPTKSPIPAASVREDGEGIDMNYVNTLFAEEREKGFALPEGYDKFADPQADYGTIVSREYESGTTGTTRKCYVYTPVGYDESLTYPVLYLLHGIGGTQDEWLGGLPVQILSNLIASGEAPPFITVIPNVRAMANDGFPKEMLGQENIDAFDNFINDLRDDLMPFIEANYSVSLKRSETAVAGLSMGGREALFIGSVMSDTFGYIGAFSPAPGLLSYPALGYPGQLAPEELCVPEPYADNTLFFICNGNQDGTVGSVPAEYRDALEINGMNCLYYTIDGGHDFKVWKNGLYHFARLIFHTEGNA